MAAKDFAKRLQPNDIVALYGDLGAGKTTFVKGLVEEWGIHQATNVISPTFTLLNIYETKPPIYHFDLYRLPSEREFFLAGFDEYFLAGGICCIEWADKIASTLPPKTYHVHIEYLDKKRRILTYEKKSPIHES